MGCRGCNKTTVRYDSGAESSHQQGARAIVRTKCDKCSFKHLAYAYVALTEVEQGYPEHIELAKWAFDSVMVPEYTSKEVLREHLDAKARAVGHLVHAMEECPDLGLAEQIRKAYTAILDGAERPDILNLLEKLNDL